MYEKNKKMRAFGAAVQQDELMMPEGVKLSTELTHALAQLPLEMELPVAGTFTPWARREGDFSWKPISQTPESNLKLYALQPNQIGIALQKLFNQPLPFLGVISPVQLPSTEVKQALEGSEYELLDTIAVFNQNDSNSIPKESYFYWLSMGPEGDKITKSMAAVAALLKGQLVLPARVSYSETATRPFPEAGFETAQNSKLTEISQEDAREYSESEQESAAAAYPYAAAVSSSTPPIFTMLLVGGAVCAATVVIGRAMNK